MSKMLLAIHAVADLANPQTDEQLKTLAETSIFIVEIGQELTEQLQDRVGYIEPLAKAFHGVTLLDNKRNTATEPDASGD